MYYRQIIKAMRQSPDRFFLDEPRQCRPHTARILRQGGKLPGSEYMTPAMRSDPCNNLFLSESHLLMMYNS